MIWVIANEVEEDGSFPTYKYYREAFAKGEIHIYCAGQDDDFSFLEKDDIVFMRTRDRNINFCVSEAQSRIGFKSTLESDRVNLLTQDKEVVKPVLYEAGISFPRTVWMPEVLDGNTYFVKARYGENSQGIDKDSICRSRADVQKKFYSLLSEGVIPIIEEYIDGEDLTTAVIYLPKEKRLMACSCITHANTALKFHSFDIKKEYDFTAKPFKSELLDDTCKKVFELIGAKHYLRIDSRIVDGVPYILDINMIAGLSPKGYMAKCLEVNGVSYHEFIRMVVESAT